MYIKCPSCGFGREVAEEKIPPKATKATCPKCQHKFEFRKLVQEEIKFDLEEVPETPEEKEPEHIPQAPPENTSPSQENSHNLWESLESLGKHQEKDTTSSPFTTEISPKEEPEEKIPWEHLDQYGFFPGLFLTIKKILLSPIKFFSSMEFGGYSKPLVYYLLLSELQAIFVFLWEMLGFFPELQQQNQLVGGVIGVSAMGLGSLLILILYPILLTLMLFLVAAFNHLFLSIFKAENKGLEGTFRAVSYGSTPLILGIIPGIGPIIGAIWSMIITIIAYKSIHQTSYLRVILALLITPFIIGLAFAFMFTFFLDPN